MIYRYCITFFLLQAGSLFAQQAPSIACNFAAQARISISVLDTTQLAPVDKITTDRLPKGVLGYFIYLCLQDTAAYGYLMAQLAPDSAFSVVNRLPELDKATYVPMRSYNSYDVQAKQLHITSTGMSIIPTGTDLLYHWNITDNPKFLADNSPNGAEAEQQNAELTATAQQALAKGDFAAAVQAYNALQYPGPLFEEVAKILIQAHSVATAEFGKQRYRTASDTFLIALNFYQLDKWISDLDESTTRVSEKDFADQVNGAIPYARFFNILADGGLFLLQGERFKESIRLNRIVLKHAPQLGAAGMQLGDAYWELKDVAGAKKAYIDYQNFMNSVGKGGAIPSRVKERLKP